MVDSLALHSSYSSIRLESFLFTEQAFRDVKARLKPGGVFAMYNFYRQGWVVGRLVKLAEKVFGTRPLVISLPYQDVIAPDQRPARLHHVPAGRQRRLAGRRRDPRAVREGPVLLALRSAAAATESLNGFGPRAVRPRPAALAFNKIGPATVELTGTRPSPDRRLAVPLPPRADRFPR